MKNWTSILSGGGGGGGGVKMVASCKKKCKCNLFTATEDKHQFHWLQVCFAMQT